MVRWKLIPQVNWEECVKSKDSEGTRKLDIVVNSAESDSHRKPETSVNCKGSGADVLPETIKGRTNVLLVSITNLALIKMLFSLPKSQISTSLAI